MFNDKFPSGFLIKKKKREASSLEPRMHAILMLPELLKLAPVLLKSRRVT